MTNANELLYLSRMGGEDGFTALLLSYAPLITFEVKKVMQENPKMAIYMDDFAQEARIQMIQAIDRYREDRDCRFTTYVVAIIERRFNSLIRYYSRPTKVQMHDTISLDSMNHEEHYMYDVIESNDALSNPTFNIQLKESINLINRAVGDLKPIEKKVYETWQQGKSYKESSEELGLTVKAYDGYVQRIKKKLRKAITRTAF